MVLECSEEVNVLKIVRGTHVVVSENVLKELIWAFRKKRCLLF